MTYYKDDNGIVYLDDPESPSAVYSVEEWVIEKERMIVGLNLQITNIQKQIDSNPQVIKIVETYPQEVKDILEQYNAEISSVEDLELEKLEKQTLLNHIEGL